MCIRRMVHQKKDAWVLGRKLKYFILKDIFIEWLTASRAHNLEYQPRPTTLFFLKGEHNGLRIKLS